MAKPDGNMPRSSNKASKSGGAARYRNNERPPEGPRPEWNDVSPLVMHRAVAACDAVGDALLFGRSRHGRSLSITVFVDSERIHKYPDTVEEAHMALVEIAEDAEKAAGQ